MIQKHFLIIILIILIALIIVEYMYGNYKTSILLSIIFGAISIILKEED